jgi:hypothetical protein
MRKQKTTEAPEQGVTLEPKHHPTPKAVSTTSTEGVIDLDPTVNIPGPNVEVAGNPNDGLNSNPNQKAKRKYTKRTKKTTEAITPTFVDRDAIRKARIQIFINYIDGLVAFDEASKRDDKFRQFDALAAELNK